ncbi:hypothetical protein EV363DRAFT_1367839 [Boletus edulis]|uniref:RRM domain-containing protein n=1 Tax=Boletus edulis BED1 TaxID=1328754 RepID=A0AAD4C347_BOLED|nr:hypothetical protein EV363DRAFT_1367839 [Boletus edulis]KAF8447336.1 hypothetical protein L210DRAFT_966703 [Boletus edulis BED1]
MSDPLLTKRLHISGLTPSITPADLKHRLSSFGKVKAMDGFGARDALGDPRKFGFVTMEISAKELVKCLNVLSGSTWKGTKLRIGEAKTDFRERLAQINSQPSRPVRPKRTRAWSHGRPSSTLPLTPLSATVAASTPGWIVTPSGRVVRPMRMRPERPLEPMRYEASTSKVKVVNGKVKKRVKPPPVRARRRLIDPTKWDSGYLKGVFLDSIPVPLPTLKDALDPFDPLKHDVTDDEEMDEDGTDSDALAIPAHLVPQLVQGHSRTILSDHQSPETAVATFPGIHEDIGSTDVRDEANTALALLGKLFGDKEDWDGRESVSVDEIEDVEDNEMKGKEMQVDEEDDIETVPRDFGEGGKRKLPKKDKRKRKERSEGDVRLGHENEAGVEALEKDIEMEQNNQSISAEVSVQPTESAPRTNLKALFAPKEDASFSLLDHLNLDLDLELELDADILGISAPLGASQENDHSFQPTLSSSQVVEFPTTKSTTKTRSRVTLDPSLPLLFPLPDSLPHPHTASSNPIDMSHRHGTSSCFLFPLASRARGLLHLPSSSTFTRSPQDTSVSIRERWEKDKSSLTHEWKKAWREARGSRRGRVGIGGETGGAY